METVSQILGVVLVAIGILVLLLALYALWRRKHVFKLISLPLLLISVLSFDAGTGYLGGIDTSPRTVTVAAAANAPNRLILLFHGYNGSGKSLVNILGAKLVAAHETVVAFEPSARGYDSNQVLAAAEEAIETHHPDEIVLYGESLGGMEVMELLRHDPSLHVHSIVFNATPSTVSNVKILGGSALKALNTPLLMHGGLISTKALRANLARDIRNAPSPEADVDEVARQKAYAAMRRVTGPTAFGELRFIASFSPPRPDEFAGRADSVSYLHAPGASDSTIKTAASSSDLRKAFTHTAFADTPIPEWGPNLHCPTPERPTPLIKRLLAASPS